MAMASLSSMAVSRTPLQGLHHPSLQLRTTRASPRVTCTALPPVKSLQSAAEGDGIGRRVGGVLLPLFAAALIGSTPVLEAVVAPHAAIAAEASTENLDAYKDLLQKIKEKRGRQGYQAPAPATAAAPAVQPEQPSVSPAAARLKEAAEKARQEREADAIRAEKRESERRDAEKRDAEAREAEKQAEARRGRETAASIAERERAAVEKVARERDGVASVTIKKKTHGFLPLFVSQFFFLLATLGVGAVLFVLPEKQLKEIQDKVDDFVDKATPVAEDAYAKAKPLAEQAWVKAQEAGVVAKPYVEKAWEQAKPMAAKAVEASKPLLKEAQVKANELLQEAQKKTK
ncbi:hypothetical protein KC19_11G024300 [Ceratodon purpureus]|uniref:Uncharacterized protein n=1 Tax=Ceratodon purpureus TaxID=3225 RepID=A0A8T0GAH2_CERPU|nr:hypothetical protein KC19_11G024300 [Ceratodon purpureus]